MKQLILFSLIAILATSCSNMFCNLYQNNCDIETKSDTIIVTRTVKVKTTEIDTFTIQKSVIDTVITTNCDSIVRDLNNLSIENDDVKTVVKVKKDSEGKITANIETERKQQDVTQKDSSQHDVEVTDTTFNNTDTIPCEPKRYVPFWFYISLLFNAIFAIAVARKLIK